MLANPELEIAIPHHANEELSVKKAMLGCLAMLQAPDAVFCYNDSKEALGAEGVAMLLRKSQTEAAEKTLTVQLKVRESSTDEF